MTSTLLDNPLILANLFYPRPARPSQGGLNVTDGVVRVDDHIVLGCRLYLRTPESPVMG